MKVAVIGATGNAGSRITAELLKRGHHVRAIVRPQTTISSKSGLDVANSDLSDVARLAGVLKGTDAVVSAYRPPVDDNDQIIGTTRRITEAVKKNQQRLLVVGGTGGLFVSPGVTVIASGHLPEVALPIAKTYEQVRKDLEVSGADWTYFAPAGLFEPGESTGKFRLGKDDLIVDASGNSRISMEDYAIAAVDELEKPKHNTAASGLRLGIDATAEAVQGWWPLALCGNEEPRVKASQTVPWNLIQKG
jgi:uncharacterized protein